MCIIYIFLLVLNLSTSLDCSVLVHSGGVNGGHYYAFIRPTLSNQWYGLVLNSRWLNAFLCADFWRSLFDTKLIFLLILAWEEWYDQHWYLVCPFHLYNSQRDDDKTLNVLLLRRIWHASVWTWHSLLWSVELKSPWNMWPKCYSVLSIIWNSVFEQVASDRGTSTMMNVDWVMLVILYQKVNLTI